MRRSRRFALVVLVTAMGGPSPLEGQWLSASDLPIIERAVAQRAGRDTVMAGWQASAHGWVRFLTVMEHGAKPIERVIRADELVVEVYGETPMRSKQFITAWRDTTLLANSLIYHRDHLGIVAHDFGPAIRLGDGDEVRDVPHPLAPEGVGLYHFSLEGTTSLRSGGDTLRVVAVAVRPRDASIPAVVGTLYIDADRHSLVRFRFTFTRSAYRDKRVSDITVSLENALVEGYAWLPWRQSISIRRESPLLDLPLSTVLRAEWEIGNYRLDVSHPVALWQGLSVAGLRAPGGTADWSITMAERLVGGDQADLNALRERAAQMISTRYLAGLPRIRLLGQGLSSALRINRVQGVTPGFGVKVAGPGYTSVSLKGAIGSSDHRLTGGASLTFGTGSGGAFQMVGERSVRDLADEPIGSGVANSISTLVANADRGDWYQEDRLSLAWQSGGLRAEAARVRATPLAAGFNGLTGTPRANPAIGNGTATVVTLRLSRRDGAGRQSQVTAEAGSGDTDWLRIRLGLAGGGPGGVEWRLSAGLGTPELPAHRSFAAGGRGTMVGIPHRQLGGRQLLLGEVSRPLRLTVPTPPLPGTRAVALTSTLAPFVAVGWAGGAVTGVPWRAGEAPVWVIGMRADLWGPLLRVELGWAPAVGSVGFTFDAHPDWWPLL